jgi:hypothetical protein
LPGPTELAAPDLLAQVREVELGHGAQHADVKLGHGTLAFAGLLACEWPRQWPRRQGLWPGWPCCSWEAPMVLTGLLDAIGVDEALEFGPATFAALALAALAIATARRRRPVPGPATARAGGRGIHRSIAGDSAIIGQLSPGATGQAEKIALAPANR